MAKSRFLPFGQWPQDKRAAQGGTLASGVLQVRQDPGRVNTMLQDEHDDQQNKIPTQSQSQSNPSKQKTKVWTELQQTTTLNVLFPGSAVHTEQLFVASYWSCFFYFLGNLYLSLP